MTSLAIVNARVFDGVGSAIERRSIHIDGSRIEAVSNYGDSGGAANVIDAAGRLVTPGLIDAHFHAYACGIDLLALEATPMSYVANSARRRLERTLARGFTTVRDVAGGDPGLRRSLDEGLIRGPRYFYTGSALSQTGGHGDGRSADSELDVCCAHKCCEVVDGIDGVRVAVRERFRRGAHAIKIMVSGGVISPTDPLRIPQYSPEEIRVVTDEARRRGSYVAAHAYSPEAVRHAVVNGVRSIEHGNLIDEETADLMGRHDAYLVPTLVTYLAMQRRGAEIGLSEVGQAKNAEVLRSGGEAIAIARAGGVAIGFGSDLMGDLETEQLSGLRVQSEVDSAIDTLRSATSVNADLLMRPDLGRIEAGACADLVIFDHDPLEDLAAFESSERTVILNGVVVA